jgi:Cu/Ag efflux protein CusF
MTGKRCTLLLLLALTIGFASCRGGANTAKEDGKRYTMQGQILALDPATKTATIAHGQIGDWMGPMAMEYSIKPDAEFQKLHVGDKIDATVVVVSDVKYYVTDVKVASK